MSTKEDHNTQSPGGTAAVPAASAADACASAADAPSGGSAAGATASAAASAAAMPYEDGPEPEHGHLLPTSMYLKVFGALIVLTLLTVSVSLADLGPISIAVALLVAAVKAGFVVGFFMHLRYDLKFYSLLFFGSMIFVALFFGLTLVDLNTRDSLNLEEGTFSKQKEAWDRIRAEQWRKEYQRLLAPAEPASRDAPTKPGADPTPRDTPAKPGADPTPRDAPAEPGLDPARPAGS